MSQGAPKLMQNPDFQKGQRQAEKVGLVATGVAIDMMYFGGSFTKRYTFNMAGQLVALSTIEGYKSYRDDREFDFRFNVFGEADHFDALSSVWTVGFEDRFGLFADAAIPALFDGTANGGFQHPFNRSKDWKNVGIDFTVNSVFTFGGSAISKKLTKSMDEYQGYIDAGIWWREIFYYQFPLRTGTLLDGGEMLRMKWANEAFIEDMSREFGALLQTRTFFNSLSFRAPSTAFGTTTTSSTTKNVLVPEDQEGALGW